MEYNFTCKEAERKAALLVFKHSFTYDGLNLMGSSVGLDCCSWKGVGCDHLSSNVIKLDLGGYDENLRNVAVESRGSYEKKLEAGEVNPALLELKFLKYLDLSYIGFNGSVFPEFLGSLRHLK